MMEPTENTGEDLNKEEEENTDENPQTEGVSPEEPPGCDMEPECDGEQVRTDVQKDAAEAGSSADVREDKEKVLEPKETETAENPVGKVELETEEHDSPVDPEQLEETKENVGNSTATVKVVLEPEGHVVTVAFAIGLSIQELKRHLASELRVPAEVLQLSRDGRVLEEQQSLMELGIRPHSSTRMEMSSTDPSSHPLRPVRPPEHDSMPDVLTVQVQTDEGTVQEVVVEIERSHQQKVVLGGYRHRLTGVEYHHAAVQTLPKKKPDTGVVVFSRESQTVQMKSQTQQCPVDISIQMTGINCYVSCVNDKLLIPGKYITADEYHDRRLRAVICLQSYARRWLAQQTVDRLKKERTRRLAWLELQEKRRKKEKEEQLRNLRQRWMNPQKREDINLLYCALEKWRRVEEKKINSFLQGAERKAALCLLLEQETEFIAEIDRHRISFNKSNYERLIRDFLDKSATPHQWLGVDGRPIEMETLDTIRAKELRDLYNNISLFSVSKEERVQHLTALARTVMEHDCQLSRDIVDLIDREVDLMALSVEARNLEGLRGRICTLFLQYVKTPAFNPKAGKLLKIPQNPSHMKKDMLLCCGCHRYLCSASFSMTASGRVGNWCQNCIRLDNVARPRRDYTLYKNILENLRMEEQQLNEETKIPFLLQVQDMWYLVEAVWASRSALGGSKDLFSLTFVRWERQKDWSPWNCILLSKEETPAHLVLADVHKAYKKAFIREVEHKHAIARQHFSHIPHMVKSMDPQLDVAMDNQSVSSSVNRATGRHASDITTA